MKKPHIPDIRELLRAATEGMTINQMRPHLPNITKPSSIRKCLERMPDAYIDRWVLNHGKRGQYEAVWCVVTPPQHCPHPNDRYPRKPQTQWVSQQAS